MLARFARDSVFYFIPTVISRGIWFFLLPLLTRELHAEAYGLFELLAILFSFLNIVLPLEISQAVGRFMAETTEKEAKSSFASTGFLFTAAVFTIYAIVAAVLAAPISRWLAGTEEFATTIRVSAVAMLAGSLFYATQNQLRWCLAPRSVALVSILYASLTAGVSATLLLKFDVGVNAIFWGQLCGATVATIVGLMALRWRVPVRLKLDGGRLRGMLAYSSPLVLSSIGVYTASFADRWMLNAWLDLRDVAIYSVGMRFAGLVGLGVGAFQAALSPLVFAHHRETETPARVETIFRSFVCLAASGLCILALIDRPLIGFWAGADFFAAEELVVTQAVAVLCLALHVFAPGLALAKRTGRIATINIVAAATNLGLNCLLIPLIGRQGAAFATLAGGLVSCSLFFHLAQRHYRIPYRWRSLLGATAITAGFLLAERALPGTAVRVALAVVAVTLICFVSIGRRRADP